MNLSNLHSPTPTHGVLYRKIAKNTYTMCFGERVTFTCPISMCQNKSWKTKWYTFDAEDGKCPMGEPVGSCPDPYMTYSQEEKYCITCLLLSARNKHHNRLLLQKHIESNGRSYCCALFTCVLQDVLCTNFSFNIVASWACIHRHQSSSLLCCPLHQ
jgi:hypothetical protein